IFCELSIGETALATLIHQRRLTPSCGGQVPTAERTVGPARMIAESLTSKPGIREHNPARNGKSRWITPAALTVRTCPLDSDVESPSRCYALTTRGCLSEERYQSTPAASNNAGTSPTR